MVLTEFVAHPSASVTCTWWATQQPITRLGLLPAFPATLCGWSQLLHDLKTLYKQIFCQFFELKCSWWPSRSYSRPLHVPVSSAISCHSSLCLPQKSHGGPLVWQQVEDESVPSGRGAGSPPAWDSHPLPSDKFDESPLPPHNPDANPVGLKQTHRCFVFQGHGTPTVMKDVTQLLTDWLEMQFVLAGCLFKVIWIHCVLVEVPFKVDWRMFN